ncbi:efflux RND transporter permease subunit [Meiothermus sp.]|uniref:efflux RND transporter permease subunit n=1 Tax=Meiothermus sp. TaxID=1955249 RepID=UPI00307D5F68
MSNPDRPSSPPQLDPRKPENPAIKFFVERFVFSTAAFLALVLFGLIAGSRVGVDLLPRFEIPVVAVTTAYPGAGPEEVETQISRRIEDSVSTLSGIDQIASISGEGFSQVIVSFDFGEDINRVATDVSQRVAAVRGQLPRDAQAPVVQRFDPAAAPILFIALSADGRDLREVARYAEDVLKPQLQLVSGVADVQIQGAPSREVQVLLEPYRLASYNLSPGQVVGAIQASALAVPAGTQSTDGQRLLFTLRNTPTTPEQIASILVDPSRGIEVRDVAIVRDGQANPTRLTRLDGEAVIPIAIRKTPDSNSVAVAQGVKRTLANARLPQGYQTRIVGDNTTFIENTVNDTFREVLLVAAIVSFITLIFLGKLNSVFSVVVAIPITLAGALIVFGLLGFTFNIISLLAIIVAVGIVVDDSIVLSENIERFRRMGYPTKEAVLKGSTEVLSAVSAATLSLMAVFLPISFLPGIIGEFFRQFGIVLAAAIAVSWLEALFFLTVRLTYFPDPEPPTWPQLGRRAAGIGQDFRWGLRLHIYQQPGLSLGRRIFNILITPLTLALAPLRWLASVLVGLAGAITGSLHNISEGIFLALRETYARTLSAALKRSWLVLLVGLGFFLSIGFVAPRIPFNFTAENDNGQIDIDLTLPKGTALSQTDALSRRLEIWLDSRPEVEAVFNTVGSSQNALGAGNPERARIVVELVPKDERENVYDLLPIYREALQKLVADRPEADLRVTVPEGGPGGAADLQFTMTAPTPQLLAEKNQLALQVMRNLPYLIDVRSSLEETASERVLVPSAAKLQGTGLTPGDLAQTLRIYNAGVEAGNMRSGGDDIPIVVKADPRFVSDQTSLLSLPVAAPALRSSLPIGSLGQFENRQTPAQLARTNQAFSTGITANRAPGSEIGTFQLSNLVRQELEKAGVFTDGVRFETQGSTAFVGDLARSAPIAFGLALLLNFLVIASQFNTFRYPLYLLLPVPLALVGAFWFLFFFRSGLDVISVLGVVILIGLVTKNAILLLDFAVRQAQEKPLYDALVEAARLRLRPILMTTLTVLMISIPLITASGEGSEFRRPLGIIILGGVSVSMLLTLFVVPAAFYQFERRRYEKMRQQRQGQVSAAPAVGD